MQSVNVCFSTSNGFFSKVIRWFTRSKASHALITFRDETLGNVFVMEANGRGFMLTPWGKWRESHTLVSRYSLALPPNAQKTSLQDLGNFLGTQYDYISLLGFALRRFFGRMVNPFNDPRKLICSEAVARFLAGAGLHKYREYGTWTPEDLLHEAKANPSTFLLEEEGAGAA